MNQGSNLNVAALGAGLIGLGLLTEIKRSRFPDCQLVVARDDQNRGLRSAAALGYRTAGGVKSLAADRMNFDVVFDASNAASHAERWEHLAALGALVIDLTPSRIGTRTTKTLAPRAARPGRRR
jgi:acetaldehyde dehydrogenase